MSDRKLLFIFFCIIFIAILIVIFCVQFNILHFFSFSKISPSISQEHIPKKPPNVEIYTQPAPNEVYDVIARVRKKENGILIVETNEGKTLTFKFSPSIKFFEVFYKKTEQGGLEIDQIKEISMEEIHVDDVVLGYTKNRVTDMTEEVEVFEIRKLVK